MSSYYFDNAIAWAQVRMRGGWKNLLIGALGYGAVAALLIGLFYQLCRTQRDKMDVLEGSSVMIMIAQTVMLLSLGGMAISSAIRKDLQGKQMESHRLMPLGSIQAIIGYLTGAGSRVVVMCVVNLIIGMVLFSIRGVPVGNWLQSNLILSLFGFMLWAVMAMAAFISRAVFWLVIGLAISIPFTGGRILMLLPGLLILCSPVHGTTVFAISNVAGKFPPLMLVSIAAQFLVAMLCIRAAARKYSHQEAVAFPAASSLALLALWVSLSWIGINFVSATEISWTHLADGAGEDWKIMVVGSFLSSLIVGLLAVAGAAWQGVDRQHRRMAGGESSTNWFELAISLGLCLVLISALLAAKPEHERYGSFTRFIPGSGNLAQPVFVSYYYIRSAHQAAGILVTCAIFLCEGYLLMRLLYPMTKWANLALAFFVGLLWFVPLMMDGIYWQIFAPYQTAPMDFLTLGSPLGSIYWEVDSPFHRVWPGLIAQFCILIFLVGIFAMVQALVRRRINREMEQELKESASPILPSPPVPMAK